MIVVVAEVVAELAELVEHEVARILGELVAGVVDLLHVRLGAVRADHVVVRVLAPALEPVEPLLAHALRQDRHAPAGHDPADGDAASCVVAGRRPDRPVTGGVELPGHDPRCEAGVRSEHLVGRDHREAVAEHDDDRALDAGQLGGQHDVLGHVDPPAGEVVVPVHPPEVAGVGPLRIGVADLVGMVERRRVGELGERRQRDAALAEALDAARQGDSASTTRSARPNWFSRASRWASVTVTIDSVSNARRCPAEASVGFHRRWGRHGRRARRSSAPPPPDVADLVAAACLVCSHFGAPKSQRDHQSLAAQQIDPGMVLGVTLGRRLQLVDGADPVLLRQPRDDLGESARRCSRRRPPRGSARAGRASSSSSRPPPATPRVRCGSRSRHRPRPRRRRPVASCTAVGSWRSARRCTDGTDGTGRTRRARRRAPATDAFTSSR